jgi:hypothetical protein
MNSSTARRALCATAVTGLAALVTACGSPAAGGPATSGTPATSASTGTSPASSAPVPSRSAASTPAGSPGTGPAAAGAPACSSRYLRANPGSSQGTAGSVYVVIVFTNLNNASCTLYGYPGVSFGAGQPVSQVGLAAAENPSTPRELVTLKPGGVASALLRIVDAGNYSAAQCHRVATTWLQVYPPNQTAQLYVHYSSTACARNVQTLTVDAVRPGSGG